MHFALSGVAMFATPLPVLVAVHALYRQNSIQKKDKSFDRTLLTLVI